MNFSAEVLAKLERLQAKYEAMGQDLGSYLEGLLESEYLPYWDYVQLDVLLNLQKPKTAYPDEQIFILYHQITELYFKLCLLELGQLVPDISGEQPSLADLEMRVGRINRYFDALTLSFHIMTEGMEPAQFLKFRMALLPASGFQSAQYRKIELHCTELEQLVHKDSRHPDNTTRTTEELYAQIYWKQGAIEAKSGHKTLTLTQFEAKYDARLLALAQSLKGRTLASLWSQLKAQNPDSNYRNLSAAFRRLDHRVNVDWPLAHYRTAVRYLHRPQEDIAATGGTNWQQYLPPRLQLRVFFPWLWTQDELEQWGKKDLLHEQPSANQ
jgi:tryptophan 2,3-dioxygenase